MVILFTDLGNIRIKSVSFLINNIMSENPIVNTSTRNLSIFYTFSLSLVACLSVSGQIIVQGMLSQQQKNLEVVSLIEERQTLCQEVIKFVALLKLEPETRNNPQQLQKLRQLVVDWKDSGEQLANRNSKDTRFFSNPKSCATR